MRKLLGTIFILVILYVGFCGIEIKTGVSSYKIPPFITNALKSDGVKKASKELKQVQKNAGEAIKEIQE